MHIQWRTLGVGGFIAWSTIYIFEPNDIILPQIVPGLHFNDIEHFDATIV